MNEDDIKQEAARRLGVSAGKLSPQIWGALRDKGVVGDVLSAGLDGVDEGDALDSLVAEYRWLSKWMSGRSSRERRSTESIQEPPDPRLKALAVILAAEAERLDEVRAFRREVLGDDLLSAGDAAHWVSHRAASERPGTAGERLAYWAKDGSVKHVRVEPGSDLERLLRLTRLLSTAYGWEAPASVQFVLLGAVPELPRAIVTTRRIVRYDALTRIIIEVDARLAPREVQRLYSRARQKVRRGKDSELGEKAITLALFVALESSRRPTFLDISARVDHPQDPSSGRRSRIRFGMLSSTGEVPPPEPWWTVREHWNARCRDEGRPDWIYEMSFADKRFARDARAAWEHVTGRRWTLTQDDPDDELP